MKKKFLKTIRPKTLDEYIGQNEIKDVIRIYLKAAIKREKMPDHLLLYGPSGLGKTTLAEIIANELDAKIKIITGGSIEKVGDLVSVLTCLEAGSVLFIDEIHRLPKYIEEVLYSAMEDFKLDILIEQSGEAKSIQIDLNPFTLIGATTRFGEVSSPLRSRFGAIFRLNYYQLLEIKDIIKRTSLIHKTKTSDEALIEIAKRSRNNPRIANRLFLRIKDFADVLNEGKIDLKLTKKAFSLLKINENGLTKNDILYLEILIKQFNGGPAGIDAIACIMQETPITIADVYEPYLLKEGYIKYTPRGRLALEKAYFILKKE